MRIDFERLLVMALVLVGTATIWGDIGERHEWGAWTALVVAISCYGNVSFTWGVLKRTDT